MVDIDRVIRRLMELVQDAHLATSLSCSSEDSVAEVVFCHHLTATEREKNTPRHNLFQSLGIEPCVSFQCIVQSPSVFCKSRRIEDDEVISCIRSIQVFESVLAERLVAVILGEIQCHILIGQLNGFRTTVYRMHQRSLSSHGIDREATCVATHIKYSPVSGILFQKASVVALINEEARLLAFHPVDIEPQSILYRHIVADIAQDETVFLAIALDERQCRLTFVIDTSDTSIHDLDEGIGDVMPADMHTHTMSLHDKGLTIAIDDQSWQVVTLAMHQPEGVVVSLANKSNSLSHLEGESEFFLPECQVDRLVVKREHPDSNRAHLEMADSDEIPLRGEYPYNVAIDGIVVIARYSARENPRMETEQALFFSPFQNYFLICH